MALLIALGLAFRVTGFDLHSLGHQPTVGTHEELVFLAAKHAEEEAHLEPSGAPVYLGCLACWFWQHSSGLQAPSASPGDLPAIRGSTREPLVLLPQRPSRLHDTRAPPIA